MFYNSKNAKILIDNREVFVSNLTLSLKSENVPVYLTQDRNSSDYVPNNGIGGSFNFSYNLTGVDYLKRYTTVETGVISGNFGGLYFTSGYLKSYNISAKPNTPVSVTAEIVFFDELKGSFSPTYLISSGNNFLNFADIVIDSINYTGLEIGDITSVNYNYSANIGPSYRIGSSTPEYILFGPKQIEMNINTNTLYGDLSIYGKSASIKVNFSHPALPYLQENISCDGIIYQKSITASDNSLINNSLTIKQNNLEDAPIINYFNPISGTAGDTVSIYGKNLLKTASIYFYDLQGTNLSVQTDSLATIKVPSGAINGSIIVNNLGGSTNSSTNFPVIQSSVSINSLSSYTGLLSGEVIISGSNFYRIDAVKFNGSGANYTVIDPYTIKTNVPEFASWGYVTVQSTARSLTGTSSLKFVPFPQINGFSPNTGISGTQISISGRSFSGVSGVSINGLNASFTVINNTGINVTIPSGNVNGYIKVSGQNGTFDLSDSSFGAVAYITGFNPISGFTGTAIDILGNNFFPEIMYLVGVSNGYLVTFQGGATGSFDRVNNGRLTGVVPSGAQSGIVAINKDESTLYPSSQSFYVMSQPPLISYVIPNSGKTLDNAVIYGNNFLGLTGLFLTGYNFSSNLTGTVDQLGQSITFQIPPIIKNANNVYDVVIRTAFGATTGTSGLFITYNPGITSFSPSSGTFGQRINLTGTGFFPDTKIYFNSADTTTSGIQVLIDDTSFIPNWTGVSFYVPAYASGTNTIIIDNGVGLATGAGLFTFVGEPIISGFIPLSGTYGDNIFVTGVNFNFVTGVKIGDIAASFSYVGTTGINFTIPDFCQSNFIDFYNPVGTTSSNNVLTVLTPNLTISGISPITGRFNDIVQASGKYLDTVYEVAFSGQTGAILSTFSISGTSGIQASVPIGAVNGTIRFVNQNGYFYSSQVFSIIQTPYISGVNPLYGKYGDTINVSGNSLNGIKFYFLGYNNFLVEALTTVYNSGNFVTLTVPREIQKGPIQISGSGQFYGASLSSFTPLPTISGFNTASLLTGSSLVLTGVNAAHITDSLFISGDNGSIYSVFDSGFNISSFRVTGNNITNPTTGYTVISGNLNKNFAGSGRLFLVPNDEGNIITSGGFIASSFYPYVSITNNYLTITASAPIINGFSPASGNILTPVFITGANFTWVTGSFIKDCGNYVSFISTLIGDTGIAFNPPAGVTGLSGQIELRSTYGTTLSSNYFRYIPIPSISGFAPVSGPSGTWVKISGSGLQNVSNVYFGDHPASFIYNNSDSSISGLCPVFDFTLPSGVYLSVISTAGTGISSSQYTVTQGPMTIYGDLIVIGNTYTSGALISYDGTNPPTGTNDTVGMIGQILFTPNFVYFKTTSGWRRNALSRF